MNLADQDDDIASVHYSFYQRDLFLAEASLLYIILFYLRDLFLAEASGSIIPFDS